MKRALKMFTHLLFIVVLLTPGLTSAANKTFIKEYNYQASEDDSRNSSRVIALREVKRLLLEELGTYLESETDVKNFQLSRDQITTLTAGIVQTEIIEEKWDGRVYWLKSKIVADSDKVVQSINELRKNREKTQELESIRQKSDELLRENERLRKALASATDSGRDARKAAYEKSIKELSSLEWLEKGYAAKNHKEAVDAYSRAIELDPKNVKAYYARARSGAASKKQDYDKVLEMEARDSESHLLRAWTYKELKKRDLALQEFGKAIETASGSKEKATAFSDRGRYYTLFYPREFGSRKNSIPGAIELSIDDFSRAIELAPKDISHYSQRGVAYAALGRADLAVRDFSKVLEMDPKNQAAFSLRGNAWLNLRKEELGVADLSKAIELEEQSNNEIDELFAESDRSMRAFVYANLGKYDLAIQDWSILIKRKPKAPSNYSCRGNVYDKQGKYDLAVKDFNMAVKLNPKDESLYIKRGAFFFKLGKDDLAIKDFNAAITLKSMDAYYQRALVYARQKKNGPAVRDLTKAVQSDPFYKKKAQTDPQFDNIRKHPDVIKLLEE